MENRLGRPGQPSATAAAPVAAASVLAAAGSVLAVLGVDGWTSAGGGSLPVDVVVATTYPLVGALVLAGRRPSRRLGWLLLGVGAPSTCRAGCGCRASCRW